MAERVYIDDACELWHGNSLDPAHVAYVMGRRKADALIFDGPFSDKTHSGHRDGKLTAERAAAWSAGAAESTRPNAKHERSYAARKAQAGESGRRDIDYASWGADEVSAFVHLWHPHVSGWRVSLTDYQLAPVWSARFEHAGLYPFAPLPLVETGSRVRMSGDGPACWACWIVVARPRTEPWSKWGALPGAYVQAAERDFNAGGGSDRVVGGKPLKSMCAIVGDYSRPGALVVDPTCAAGTTIQAAKILGRRAIGIDTSRERLAIAARRLSQAREQRTLFAV